MDAQVRPDTVDRRWFFQFTKVDAARREVAGIFTAERPDKDGETLDYDKSKPYFQQWSSDFAKATYDPQNPGRLSLGNVRVMHTNKAAGKLTALDFDDAQKIISGVSKIVDDDEWKKCESGVYTGFSIGGKYIGGKPLPGQKYTAAPVEISIVDNPALPEARFAYVKQDGTTELRKFAKADAPLETSMAQRQQAIAAALEAKYRQNLFSPFGPSWWLRDVFDDYVVVDCGGKLYRVPYTLDADQDSVVTLGDPVEVHVAYVPELAEKALRLVLADVEKDHESFQVTQGGQRRPELAGPGQGRMVDVDPPVSQQAPRSADGPFDEDEDAVQSLSIGVVKDADACPCEDCRLERSLLAAFPDFAAMLKAEQAYATHSGERVPRGKHAYAPTGTSASQWKYPIDKPGRVRAALSRWGQEKGIPESEKPGVARRILSAAKKFGITVDPDHPMRVAAATKAMRESDLSQPADLGKVAAEVWTMDITTEQLQKMVSDAVAATVPVVKGQKKEMASALSAMKKLHGDYHQQFMGHMDKVLKDVAHGNDPANIPTDINPTAEITTVGDARPDQLADGPPQAWKATLQSEIAKAIQEQVAPMVVAAVAASTKTVMDELGKALGGPAIGDRRQVVDKRAPVDPKGFGPAGATQVSVADMAKALDSADVNAAILAVMKGVEPEVVPSVLQKSSAFARLGR